jgi:hypothetical protein
MESLMDLFVLKLGSHNEVERIFLTYGGPRVYEGETNHHHIKEEIFYLMGITKMDLEREEENQRLVTQKR